MSNFLFADNSKKSEGVYDVNGIVLINEHWCLENSTKQESKELQKSFIQTFIREQQIHTIKLNPYQSESYYTIPHALLYDLKQTRFQLDSLIIYSESTIADFIYAYPAKWVLIKSYFKDILFTAIL